MVHKDINALNCLKRIKRNVVVHQRSGNEDRNMGNPNTLNTTYFNLKNEEINKIETMILNAEPNEQESVFPDFLSNSNCCIEHFQISQTKESKKGAKYKQIESKYDKEADEYFKTITGNNNEFKKRRKEVYNAEYVHPEKRHEYLIKSFVKNWEKHMNSLKKSEKNYEGVAFLVELPELGLKEINLNGQEGDWYKLSRDKVLLDYIFGFSEFVDFTLFSNIGYFEIFKNDSVQHLIGSLSDVSFEAVSLSTTYEIYSVEPFIKE